MKKSRKGHIIFSGNDDVSENIVNNIIICENKNELLGIMLDSKLSFEDHIDKLCKKMKSKTQCIFKSFSVHI